MSGTPHDHTIDTFELLRAINLSSTEKERDNIMKCPELKNSERAVLNNLALRRNSVSFKCNPSIARIAEDLNTTRGSVSKAIGSLKEKGVLRVTRRQREDSKENLPSQYWIMLDINKIHNAFNDEESEGFIIEFHEDMYDIYNKEFR